MSYIMTPQYLHKLAMKSLSVRIMTLFIVSLLVGLVAPQTDSAAMQESIAAIVNEDPITKREVQERLKLVMVSSKMPNKPEIKARLKPQILDQLIEEQLKIQEARRLDLTVTPEEIQAGIASVAQSNNMSPEDFKEILHKQDVKLRTLKRQVRSQIAWSKVVSSQIRPKVDVNDQDIQAELDRLRENIGKKEFLLAEIYLPFNKGHSRKEIKNLADNIVGQIVEKGAPFPRLAQQFSQSAAAARGGDLGWIQQGQLSTALDEAVRAMKKGSLSPPIETLSGYHILLLREIREIKEENLPSKEQIKQKIGMDRIERRQRRYLLDLRSAAFIDIRV